MIRLNRKGQNTLEYVLLITAVVVGFLLVQHYLNRGLQGRVREASDNIGDQFDADNTTMNFVTTRGSTVTDTNTPTGAPDGGNIIRSEITSADGTYVTGTEVVAAPEW
ncbi:hypothetical protein ACFL2I_03305 [Candidatus Omnitrophota bacterium]